MIEYFENYVNNYAVVFNNYAHFSKTRRNYALLFPSNLVKIPQ